MKSCATKHNISDSIDHSISPKKHISSSKLKNSRIPKINPPSYNIDQIMRNVRIQNTSNRQTQLQKIVPVSTYKLCSTQTDSNILKCIENFWQKPRLKSHKTNDKKQLVQNNQKQYLKYYEEQNLNFQAPPYQQYSQGQRNRKKSFWREGQEIAKRKQNILQHQVSIQVLNQVKKMVSENQLINKIPHIQNILLLNYKMTNGQSSRDSGHIKQFSNKSRQRQLQYVNYKNLISNDQLDNLSITAVIKQMNSLSNPNELLHGQKSARTNNKKYWK